MHIKLLVNAQRFEKSQAHAILPSRSYSITMIENGPFIRRCMTLTQTGTV